MANEVKWTSPTNVPSPISGASVNAGAGNLGAEYNNETNKKRFAAFELTFSHASAPAANRVWLLFLLYCLDGTVYEDGGNSIFPNKMQVATFPVRAVTGSQVVTVPNVLILPFRFKPLIWNDTNQNGTSVTLDMEVYGEEIQ